VACSKVVVLKEKIGVEEVVEICRKPQWKGKELWKESHRFLGGKCEGVN
jgi:hypothetical protein